MSDDRSLMDEFIAESREHLESIETDFIQLEKNRTDPDPELVNRIFRAVHTVKGSAGFFGLKNIGALAHGMETLLAMVRDKVLTLQSAHIDALLEGVDTISAMLDDVDHSNELDIATIQQTITALIDRDASGEVKEKLATTVRVPDSRASEQGFEISGYDISALPDEYRHFYVLRYELAEFEERTGTSPVALLKELMLTGQVLDGYLEGAEGDLHEGVPHRGLHYVVLYATVMESDLIGTAVDLPDEAIQPLDRAVLLGETSTTEAGEPEPAGAGKAPEAGDSAQETSRPPARPRKSRRQESATPGSVESVRIRVDILDRLMMLAGELVLVRNQQLTNVKSSDPATRGIAQRLDIVTSELQETIMRTRMQPIGTIFGKFTRIVRDLGKKLGKRIEIEMTGNEVELDKAILEALADPLTHLIRNSCDHGIEPPEDRREFGKPETGHIRLRAYHEAGQMNIEISDDGHGIDAEGVKRTVLERGLKTPDELARLSPKEALSLIFLPGLSTAEQVSDLSGRGVGMDVVKTSIERLGGLIEIESTLGRGTDIYLRLPLTLAIIPSLIVKMGETRYAIPQMNLEELVCLYDEEIHDRIECAGSREVYRLRDHLLPMVYLREVLDRHAPFDEAIRARITEHYRALREECYQRRGRGEEEADAEDWALNFAVLRVGATRYGLIIDRVVGSEEIVVKPMHRAVKDLGIYSGATVLGDGQVALILDALGIARHAGIEFNERSSASEETEETIRDEGSSLLLFGSGPDEQFAVETPVVRRIERIDMTSLEHAGGREYITLDGQPTLILRLDAHMGVSACVEREEMFLLLPKSSPQPCGILASRLVDIGTYELDFNADAYRDAAVKGSGVVRGHMTLLLDLEALMRGAVPEWFTTAAG
jgi:two-component system chemotaxis sensor kinase CheA